MNPGDRVGNYEIIEKVGAGAMGDVYRANQLSMSRHVALKILPAKYAADEKFVARFIREARSAGQCNHGNLIQVYEVGQADDKYFFSMEFVGGLNLRETLQQKGPMPEAQAITYMIGIAGALQEAHSRKIVHRDVKPANVILNDRGEPKLADLGLAKPIDADSEDSNVGRPIGTPYYMSPEQVRSDLIDGRADLYALGATFYHLMTGETLFSGPNPGAVMAKQIAETPRKLREVRKDLSRSIEAVVMKLIAKEPDQRYQDAPSLIDDLKAVAAGKHPKHANLLLESGRQRRAQGTKGTLRAVQATSAAPQKGVGMYVALGAVPVALIMVVAYVMTRAEPELPSSPPPSSIAPLIDPVAMPTLPTAEPDAAPGPAHDAEQLEEMLAKAEQFLEDNPDNLDGAIQKYEVVSYADPDGDHGNRAKEKIATLIEAQADRRKAALSKSIDAAAERMAEMDFDGALQVYADLPQRIATKLAREIVEQTTLVRETANDMARSSIAEAQGALKSGDLDDTRKAVRELRRVKFRDMQQRIDGEVRRITDAVADAERQKADDDARAALAKFTKLLPELEDKIKAGMLIEARQLAERGGSRAKGTVAKAFDSAARVVKAIEARRSDARKALRALASGKGTVTLRTTKGDRKGKIEDVTDETIVIAVTIIDRGRVMGSTRFNVAWSDLKPGELARLAGKWEPEDAHGHAAVALVAVCAGDADGATTALARAGDHPMKAYLSERIDALRAGPVEAAARAAWNRIEPRLKGSLSEARAKGLLAEIEAYDKEHGATEHAKSIAKDITAAKRRCMDAMSAVSSVGLVAHWRFDDGSGNVARDSSGKAHHGKITNCKWVAGKRGGALQFNGRTSQVLVDRSDAISWDNKDFTLAAWVKTRLARAAIIAKTAPLDKWVPNAKVIFVRRRSFGFDSGWVGAMDGRKRINDDQWHHVVFTFDGATRLCRTYIDGAMDMQKRLPLKPDPAGSQVCIGSGRAKHPGGQTMNGTLDDIRIYKRRLTDEEIARLGGRKATAAGPAAGGLAAHWRFDEGRGAKASGTGGDVRLHKTAWAKGRYGRGLQFNGKDSYAEIPVPARDDLTIALWVRTKQKGGGGNWYGGIGLVDGETRGPGPDFGLTMMGGVAAFGSGARDKTIRSKAKINDGKWHHVAAMRSTESGEMQVYVDGKLEATGPGRAGTLSKPQTLKVGCVNPTRNFLDGTIDDLRIFSRRLTVKELQRVMANKDVAAAKESR